MAYNRNIPQPTDLISNSQPSILGNFQAIDSGTTGTGTGFSRNHVTLTDGTDGGLHNRIDFHQNIAAPAVVGFVSSLYPANIAAASELQYTNASGSTQITSGSLPIWKGGTVGTDGVVTATLATSGTMTLPNGLIFKWGRSSSGADPQVITFPVAFPTLCFNVQLTATGTSTTASACNVQYPAGFSRTGFTFRYAGSSINGFFWFAIGN